MYNITSVWCPEKKRTKKVTLKQVGVIDQEFGLIPTGMSRRGKVPEGASKIKENAPQEADFMDKFESIDDPRAERNRLYSIAEIILVTFLAIICGAEGWKDVENYGKAKIAYLQHYFPYHNGTPSDDTIRRFFRQIDPEQFKAIFCEWVRCLAQTIGAQVIAIDGKSSRHSYDGEDTPMLHTVSAFATEARIVLGQEKVVEKSNEITAIPKLLNLLDIKGHIVTIDAMGCQYEIANQILAKEGQYIFSLKGNQGTLNDDVTLYLNDPHHSNVLPCFTHTDKGHGRIETRKCFVESNVSWLKQAHPKWHSIGSVIRIDSVREFTDGGKIKHKTETFTRYFVSSLTNPTPEAVLHAIRSHWMIENGLHWVLDMSFNEDYCRIRKGNAPFVVAIIRHFALNLLQKNQPKRQSIKGYRKICAWNDNELTKLIAKSTPSI